jgi:hypothetical protein
MGRRKQVGKIFMIAPKKVWEIKWTRGDEKERFLFF